MLCAKHQEGQLRDVYTGGRQESAVAANIERALTQRDEFGRIMTPKERFRVLNYGCAPVALARQALIGFPACMGLRWHCQLGTENKLNAHVAGDGCDPSQTLQVITGSSSLYQAKILARGTPGTVGACL